MPTILKEVMCADGSIMVVEEDDHEDEEPMEISSDDEEYNTNVNNAVYKANNIDDECKNAEKDDVKASSRTAQADAGKTSFLKAENIVSLLDFPSEKQGESAPKSQVLSAESVLAELDNLEKGPRLQGNIWNHLQKSSKSITNPSQPNGLPSHSNGVGANFLVSSAQNTITITIDEGNVSTDSLLLNNALNKNPINNQNSDNLRETEEKSADDKKNGTSKENTVNENAVKENAVKENAIKQNTIRENTIKENTIKENIKENTIKENTIRENTIKEIIKEYTIKENTIKENTIKENSIRGNTIRETSVIKKTTSNKEVTLNKDILKKQMKPNNETTPDREKTTETSSQVSSEFATLKTPPLDNADNPQSIGDSKNFGLGTPVKMSLNGDGKVNLNDLRFKCPECNKMLYRSDYLRMHLKMHISSCDTNVCEVCGEKFTSPKELRQHRTETHFAFNCPVCYKRFTSLYNLKMHKLKNCIKCYRCNMVFTSSGYLKTHLKTHAQFTCKYCSKFLKTEEALKRHLSVYHKGKNRSEMRKSVSEEEVQALNKETEDVMVDVCL